MLDPSTLKVTELKAELKKYGLPVGGLKKELVERLTDHLEKLNAPEDAEEEEEEEEEPEEVSPSAGAGSESHTEAGDNGSSPVAQIETIQTTKAVEETPIVQDEVATNAEDSSMTVDEDEGQKVEIEESKETSQETAKDDDTAMNDAPEAEDVGVKPVEQIEGEQITKELTEKQLPEIIEPTQESLAHQPTVETAAPSPLPSTDVPKSPNQVLEPTTNAPTPLRDQDQERDDVPKVVPEASTMSIDTEMELDLKLRKKRSRTPSMTKDEVELKKAKIQEDTTAGGLPPVVFETELEAREDKQKEDEVLEDAAPVENEDKRDDTDRRQSRSRSPTQKETRRDRDRQSHSRSVSRSRSRSRSRSYRSQTRSRSRSRSHSPYSRKRPSIVAAKDDVRFKDLFNQNETSTTTAGKDTATSLAQEANNTTAKADDSDEDIEPATHPATRALYIRDLVRPLQEAQLRNHLISLASRSEDVDGNHDVLKVLHLDSIKTHCFAIFDSVKSCSRARNGVHGKIWPNEKNRKVLFADFVPEDKVDSWISLEKVERHRRFHVVYRQSDNGDDEDGQIEAVLDDVSGSGAGVGVTMGMTQPGSGAGRASVSSSSAAGAAAGGSGGNIATLRGAGVGPPIDAPSGPRHPNSSGRLMRQDSLQNSSSGGNNVAAAATTTAGSGSGGGSASSTTAVAAPGGAVTSEPRVVSLEDLFLFTKTKPRLYYKPVDEAIAKERLSNPGSGGAVGRQSQSQGGNQHASSGRDHNRNSAGAGASGGGDSYYGVAYRGDRNRDRRERRGGRGGGGAAGGGSGRGDRGRGGVGVGKGDSWTGRDRNWDRAWVRDGGRGEKSRGFRDRDAGRSRSRSRDRR